MAKKKGRGSGAFSGSKYGRKSIAGKSSPVPSKGNSKVPGSVK